MIKVAINGYGTIGKRVADAVAAQKDMKVIGVSKTRPNAEAFVAKHRGYPLFIADLSKKAAFEKAGLQVPGLWRICAKQPILLSMQHREMWGQQISHSIRRLGIKAIWQGGEDHNRRGSLSTLPQIIKMQLAGSL